MGKRGWHILEIVFPGCSRLMLSFAVLSFNLWYVPMKCHFSLCVGRTARGAASKIVTWHILWWFCIGEGQTRKSIEGMHTVG